MATQRKLTASDQLRVLRNLPEGATRVQVIDDKGKTCWKRPDDVGRLDTIVFNNSGDPVIMRGRPGRKAKPQLEPINDNVAETVEAKREHLREDALTRAVEDNPESDTILDIVMRELAGEASSLEFERMEAERNGRDTSTYSLRRANILKATGEMWLKRKEKVEAGMLDIDSPAFEILFTFMLETFREAMEDSGMRPELVETTFAKLSKRLEAGWKPEAKARMRGAK